MKLQFAEISRRGVFKTLVAYVVTSWVLVEVVSVIAPAFLLPNWTVAVVATFAVLGAFPVLWFSWHYEFSSEGIRRDSTRVSDEIDRFVKRVSSIFLALLVAATAALWTNYFNAHNSNELDAIRQAQQGAPQIGEDGIIRSIAVLPFEDYSAGSGRRPLADGIPEAILHVLAQNKELLVTARTSSFFFRGKDVTASEIGRILNVQALLEGSVQVSGDRLRVTSQLVRTADQGHIWSNVYEASIDDLFEVQDTIAANVRDLVMAKTGLSAEAARKTAHPNLEAYELLIEARGLLDDYSRDSAERSIALLRLAIEISPDYADAHAWLTMALTRKAEILLEQHTDSWDEVNGLYAEIDSITLKTLELDPDNAIAILQKGQISQSMGGQGYEEAAQKALAVAPNDPDILSWVALLEYQQLNHSDSRALLRRASQVDPGNFTILEQYVSDFCGREDLAPFVAKRLSSYSTSAATALRLKGHASRCDGQYADFITALTRLIRIDTEPASALLTLQSLANLGDERALELLDEAHKLVPGAISTYPIFTGVPDLSIYFQEITEERIKTFRWHSNNDANPYFFMTAYGLLQIQAKDFSGADKSLDFAQKLWDGYYAYRNERVMSMDTFPIYALRAWVSTQLGDTQGVKTVANELLEVLQQRGLDQWSESRDQLHHIPLLVLLLNGERERALQWLRDAEDDRWLGFQAVLTSPLYDEFREIDEVEQILARLVTWRTGELTDLRASALPELIDPSLLLAKIESINPPSQRHRANIAFGVERDYQAAARYFENALAKEDLDSALLADVLHFAYTLGEFEKATSLAEFAVARKPDEYFTHYHLGFSHFWAERWAPAIESFQVAQDLQPDSTFLYRWIGLAKIMLGDAAGGMQAMQQLPDGWTRLVGLAIANHALGKSAESDAALAELVEKYAIGGAFNIAYVLAYRGEEDSAFEWLQKAIDNNNRGLISIAYQPLFKNMRGDPRWSTMLRGLGIAPEQVAGIEFSAKPSDW